MLARVGFGAALLLGISSAALAEDKAAEINTAELRERISCFPAKGISKFISKFNKIDSDKRDSVDMVFSAGFEVKDGGVLPDRLFMRDNDVEQNFMMDAEGNIPDFEKIGSASESAELCTDDPSREGTPRGTGFSFSIDNDVHFLENTGYHDLATLKDGLKDGKSHYKKMVPGPMRMLVPKLGYVMIEYEADKTTPQFSAMTGQTPIEGLGSVSFCDNAMIKIKELEGLGADGLKVMGGAYKLTPVPGPKTLAKFTECEGEAEE